MDVGKIQPVPEWNRPRGDRVIGYLASVICLAGAVYYLWTTRDVVVFLLLIGVATGQIPIWEAIGRRRRENVTQTEEGK